MWLTGHAQLQVGDGLVLDIKSGAEAINEVIVVLLFCAHFHILLSTNIVAWQTKLIKSEPLSNLDL